ncbi:alpha-L-rhamnosidase-related protein [Pleomorphovibrio marinus]|uniref:alpha-L-rhamnosidase-related protein n=1 Tax=Pleomorphovibrio marinus TaxID=2164132 RepID=UPI001E31025A|nr:alpha-L-rhamnosidase C-terminal domain-containing protein [Pleomorphovibrio marinus]
MLVLVICLSIQNLKAQLPPSFGPPENYQVTEDSRSRKYLSPQQIFWKSTEEDTYIENPSHLLGPNIGQAILTNQQDFCRLRSSEDQMPGILLDFGINLHGGIQLVTGMMQDKEPVKIRVRFGESVSEAMSEIDTVNGATNDHAMRDFVIPLPWLGKIEVGNSGFRYVRIDLVEPNRELIIKEANAIFVYRDIPYIGSFKSSDERLNSIWDVGAYTVHLNMQEYLWDGIKRDRLVWVGDMHPEVSTINAVFGYNEVVPKSLDLIRDITPMPQWMNGISTYSMWWVIIHRDWYLQHGDLEYLREQKAYLTELLSHMSSRVEGNRENLDGTRFLDWPSSENREAVHAGLQAMLLWAFEAAAEIFGYLDEDEQVNIANEMARELKTYQPDAAGNKQAAALMALTGLMDAEKANKEILTKGGVKGFSTFYGYYMLEAMAKAGNHKLAMDYIKEYWGGMLDLGATTFWEDFDIEWMENAGRIDEFVPDDKVDVHASYGGYSYEKLRHNLSHGWASGPTAWLSSHVLGVKVKSPGGKEFLVSPHLGNLEWVEGSYPTSEGPIHIRHEKMQDGSIQSKIEAPPGIQVKLAENRD